MAWTRSSPLSNNGTRRRSRVRREDVDSLGQGVRVYGSGGGGDPDIACSVLRRVLTAHPGVQVVGPDALAPGTRAAPFGFIGATSLLSERPPSGEEMRDLWSDIDGAPDALIPMEIGGFNGVAAVWAAAVLDVPLVDADFMGRALPELQQLLPVTRGWTPCPAVVVDVHGRHLTLDHMTPNMLEAIARAALTPMGGWAVLVCQPVAVEDIADSCHLGTVSRALRFGRGIDRLKAGLAIESTAELEATVLGTGRVVEITRGAPRPGRRLPVTTLVVELAGATEGVLRLEAESEWIAAVVNGAPVATVPEILLVWDVDSREVLAVESARYGRNVAVTAIAGSPAWWRPDALPLVEPSAFGLDIPPCRLPSAGPDRGH